LPVQLAGQMVDGVILGGYINPRLQDWLKGQKQYPWVQVDEPSDYCTLSSLDDGMFEAVQHLVALGHRRIAHFGGPEIYLNHQLGRQGFVRAVQTFGVQEINVVKPDYNLLKQSRDWSIESAQWARRVLTDANRPTAIVTHGLITAHAVSHVATQMDLDIPRDLSIISIGPSCIAETSQPFISTIEQDFKTQVEKALDILEKRIANDQTVKPQTQWIRPHLVMRDSVAPPSSQTQQ
jgi:LacI family transcriptional regulator